jgi:hypothetical protein
MRGGNRIANELGSALRNQARRTATAMQFDVLWYQTGPTMRVVNLCASAHGAEPYGPGETLMKTIFWPS